MNLKDNKRYAGLEVEPGTYIPDVGIDYPTENPLDKLVKMKIVKEIKFDETYPFLDTSLGYKIRRDAFYLLFLPLVRVYSWVRYGVRYHGRENLRKYRAQLANGAITVCNHCFLLDAALVSFAVRHRIWFPSLNEQLASDKAMLIRPFGGIPLADGSFSAQKKFYEAFDEIHRRKGWIHVFPEARSWHYYKPVKPFQSGAFSMALKYDVPIVPVNISYRERKGFRKLLEKPGVPLLTVTIGEPIFPDKSAPRKKEIVRLAAQAHASICKLAGITKNTWPAVANE